MTKEICIVGSGPSGITAAHTLLKKSYSVTLVDNSVVSSNFLDRPRLTKRFLQNRNISPKFLYGHASQLLEKKYDFLVNNVDDKPLIIANNIAGGHSKIWGAATPNLDLADTTDLGIDGKTLRHIEDKILSDIMPCTSIYELFSLKKGLQKRNYLRTPSGKFYTALKESNIEVRYSKVAVSANRPKDNCVLCGYCIKGCRHNAIWDASQTIEKLKQFGKKFKYLTNHELIKFVETKESVFAIFKTDNLVKRIPFAKLLIACGTIPSTKIVSRSLGITGKIRLHHNPFSASAYITNALANSMESFGLSHHTFSINSPSFSSNFNLTFDCSTIPEYIISERVPGPFKFKKTISRYVNKRSIIVLTYLGSDKSDLWIKIDHEGQFSFETSESCGEELSRITRYLGCKVREFGVYQLPFSFKVGSLGADSHYGGTIPMTKPTEEKAPLYSDHEGRPNNCKNVHVIDGSILNYLPAKNFTKKIMVNSFRIADTL